MKVSTQTILIKGFAPSVTSVGETMLVNLAEQQLDGIYYDVLGKDSILYHVEVDHPTVLQAGKNTNMTMH